MSFSLPPLPFAPAALAARGMSQETLELHHGKHHAAYVTALNGLVEKNESLKGKSLEEIIRLSYGREDLQPVFNNAGQHWNHSVFWESLSPSGGGVPGSLEKKLNEDFGSVDKFKEQFKAAAVGQFGSGWAWLSVKNGKLEISKTANGESPLVHGATPILGVDVWEHSYYIDYRNRRPDYLKAFVDHLVNWEYVEQLFEKA